MISWTTSTFNGPATVAVAAAAIVMTFPVILVTVT